MRNVSHGDGARYFSSITLAMPIGSDDSFGLLDSRTNDSKLNIRTAEDDPDFQTGPYVYDTGKVKRDSKAKGRRGRRAVLGLESSRGQKKQCTAVIKLLLSSTLTPLEQSDGITITMMPIHLCSTSVRLHRNLRMTIYYAL